MSLAFKVGKPPNLDMLNLGAVFTNQSEKLNVGNFIVV